MPSQFEYQYGQVPCWELISAPNLADSEHREFMITCRRECRRTTVHSTVSALHNGDEKIAVPKETPEYIYVVVVGSCIPSIEAFTESLQKRIDERILYQLPVTNLEIELPPQVDYFLVNTPPVYNPQRRIGG